MSRGLEYGAWDQAIEAGNVTDVADGWPDERIVPIVRLLRRRGFTTLQSCSGHFGEPVGHGMWDGHLWILADCPPPPVGTPFSTVELALWPGPPRWELGWKPDDLDAVLHTLDVWSAELGEDDS